MAAYFKRRSARGMSDDMEKNVRRTVETILEDVKRRGDEAVRKFSIKFDKWSLLSFLLSGRDIESIIAKVSR